MPITFTATAGAGATPVEYKFWRYTAATGWTVARDYSSSNSYTWYPPIGSNALQVWVRAVGSTTTYQDWASTGAFDIVAPPASISSLQANVAFPASPTTTITWTVLASGGVGALEYKFYRFDPSSGWIVMRDWSQSNQASWTPGTGNTGEHAVQVWARSVGSSAAYEDWRGSGTFSIAAPDVTLIPDTPLVGLQIGQPITWTATASGPVGPWEFKFIAFDGTAWRVLQDYSPLRTLHVVPAGPDLCPPGLGPRDRLVSRVGAVPIVGPVRRQPLSDGPDCACASRDARCAVRGAGRTRVVLRPPEDESAVHDTSSNGQGEHDDVRLFSHPIEDDFATVGGDVEVADGKLATEIGQLALAPVLRSTSQNSFCEMSPFRMTSASSSAEKSQPPGAPGQNQGRKIRGRTVCAHRSHRKFVPTSAPE